MKLPTVAEIPAEDREPVALGLGLILAGLGRPTPMIDRLIAPEDQAETKAEAHRLIGEIQAER